MNETTMINNMTAANNMTAMVGGTAPSSSMGGMGMSGFSDDDEPFCYGMRMTMYMLGFRFGLKGNQRPCLNLFFIQWTLNSRGKFVAAMIGLFFFLAMAVEGLSKLRLEIVQRARKAHTQTPPGDTPSAFRNPHVLRFTVMVMHGLQAMFGYILMFAAMSLAVELTLAVILGLSMGYALFFKVDNVFSERQQELEFNDPCSEVIQKESKEADFTSPSHLHANRNEDDNPVKDAS